jgi:hypothetical protein
MFTGQAPLRIKDKIRCLNAKEKYCSISTHNFVTINIEDT